MKFSGPVGALYLLSVSLAAPAWLPAQQPNAPFAPPDSVEVARAASLLGASVAAFPGSPQALHWLAAGNAFAAGTRPGALSGPAVAGGAGPRPPSDSLGGIRMLEDLFAAAGVPPRWADGADVELSVRGRVHLGGAWDRTSPCAAASMRRCQSGSLPRIGPDLDLTARAQGTLAERVHLQLDYNRAQDAGSANTLRLYYQGTEEERLKRVEAGHVAFELPNARLADLGMPASHFGIRALGRIGPVDVQALWAESRVQSGSREFRLADDGDGTLEDIAAVVDDADYVRGQFFFLFDPAAFGAYPHLDVRALRASDAPADLVPTRGIHLYRYSGAPPAQDGSTRILRASPREPEHHHEAVAGAFHLLRPGIDYHLHSSGTWLVLARPLGDDEALGVAYHTTAGAIVGDLDGGAFPLRELRLIKGLRATHQPGSATWPLEMHHVYRLAGGGEIDPASVRLIISLGDVAAGVVGRPHPAGGAPLSFVQLFGLAGEGATEQIERRYLYRPAVEGADSAVTGTFLIFPTLHPFAEPPPVPSRGLSASATRAVLGRDSVPGIYREPDARARREARRFRLNVQYATVRRGIHSMVSLGTAGLRPGSERVTLGGIPLQRGIDYDLRYDTGELEFRNPALLYGGGDLRVTFEQDPLFQSSPVALAGLSATYTAGPHRHVTLFGVSRRERSLFRRPELGSEPTSAVMGGLSGRATLRARPLERALGWMTPAAESSPVEVVLSGDLVAGTSAFGASGVAYLEDFEGGRELVVPLARQVWRLASAPRAVQGAEAVLPAGANTLSAATLVWQHDYRRSDGRIEGSVRTVDVDTLVRSSARDLAGGALYLTFAPRPQAGAGPGWRAITHVLSTTGVDLRDHEFLEFYVRGGNAHSAALVIDLGTVSEDAAVMDDDGADGGVDAEGRPWGRGILDREWDPTHETWTSSRHDQRGLWNSGCHATPGETYPLGDPRANCTRNNGMADTEDLNGNGVLDTDERVLRYVVELSGAGSPYLVRDREGTGTDFRLYRVPLRSGTEVGATASTLHHVQHLRLLIAGGGPESLTVTRMRFVGSGWQKRGRSGVARGLLGMDTVPASAGELQLGLVSRVTHGGGYVSPPGLREERQNPADELGVFGGGDYNEKALALRYRDLQPGARAEAALAFEGRRRSLLGYRMLRLWVLSTEGGGEGEDLILRMGTDAENYYLYRAPLRRGAPPMSPADWGPEVVIDLTRWMDLRARAEAVLQDRRGQDWDPLVVWDADSTYAVVMTDRGRAPNLAALSEISVAVWNGGAGSVAGEVWINDIRLGDPVREPGAAAQVNLGIRRQGVFHVEVAYASQSGHFRAFGRSPAYEGSSSLTMTSTWEVGGSLPARLRIDAPLTVQMRSAGSTPLFIPQSDIPVARFSDFPAPQEGSTQINFRIGRRADRAARSPLDGLGLHLRYENSSETSLLASHHRTSIQGGMRYRLELASRSFGLLPDSPATGASDDADPPLTRRVLEGLAGPRLRWTPTVVTLTSEFLGTSDARYRFETFTSHDPAEASRDHLLQSRLLQTGSIGLRPLATLSADVSLRLARNLLPDDRQNASAAEAIARERSRFGPLNLGREAERSIQNTVTWSPRLGAWLLASATVDNRFAVDANPSYVRHEVNGSDTTSALLRTINGQRSVRGRLSLVPSALIRTLGLLSPDGSKSAGAGLATYLAASTSPVELTWTRSTHAFFDRAEARPGFTSQIGIAGDDLRILGSDTASSRTTSRTYRVATRLQPFAGIQLGIGYEHSSRDAEGSRPGLNARVRKWPDLEVEWRVLPVERITGGGVSSLVVGTGLTYAVRTTMETGSGATIEEAEAQIPVSLRALFRGGLAMAYRGDLMSAGHEASYNRTRGINAHHTITATGPVRVPALFGFDARQFILGFSLAQAERRECRVQAFDGCQQEDQFLSTTERLLRLQADTKMRDFKVGLHGDYVYRGSRTGERELSRHFRIGLFVEFEIRSRPGS